MNLGGGDFVISENKESYERPMSYIKRTQGPSGRSSHWPKRGNLRIRIVMD